jgi:positive regulator of sigma E activity
MDESGIVIQAGSGAATVRMTASPACDGCGQASGCHPGQGSDRTLAVRDPLGVRPGQAVTVRLPGRGVWAAMGLIYGWPLAMLFFGAWAGFQLGGGGDRADLLSAGGALLGLAAGFGVLRLLRPWYEGRALFKAVIVHAGAAPGPSRPDPPGIPPQPTNFI